MPILTSSSRREFAIMLTHQCNWRCQYCAVKNKHDQSVDVSDEAVLENAKLVAPMSIVTLFGGEPGLVKRDLLEKCMQILEDKQCILYLETNGTFIKRYPDLLEHFAEVLYHCSEDLADEDQVRKPDFKRVRWMIIVHDKNIDRLQSFLEKHKDIKFDIIEATYPYPEEMDGPRLSRENKKMLIEKFASRMTSESLYRLLNGKDFERIEFLDG